jgi:27-O-demethylrifamycin SV methyltransferase
MTGDATSAHEPASHYNAVVGAWRYLLLEDLHYGYFETGAEPLIIATDALTDRMLALAKLEPGNHVLDIGCGTGKAACRIAEALSCHVKGISPSVRCVSDAAAKAA